MGHQNNTDGKCSEFLHTRWGVHKSFVRLSTASTRPPLDLVFLSLKSVSLSGEWEAFPSG